MRFRFRPRYADVAATGVVFSPFRVESAGSITARACNVTPTSISVTDLGVRFVTFG